jgi:hypothetical protein
MSASVLDKIVLALSANIPVLWWGAPGVGKTALSAVAAARVGKRFLSVSAAYLAPEDVAGIPFPSTESGRIQRRHDEIWHIASAEPCVVLLDEVNRAQMPTMNALLRVLEERLVGDRPLHPETVLILTANPSKTDRSARDMPSAAANRCLHLNDPPELDFWFSYMASRSQYSGMVAGFLRSRPQLADALPANATEQGGAWPSRRSWTKVADLLDTADASNQLNTGLDLTAGLVGIGAATELVTFLRDQDLPDPAQILTNPSTIRIPTRMDQLFATASSVVGLARRRFTAADYKAAETFLVRLGTELGHRDIGAIYYQTLLSGKEGQPMKQPAGFMFSSNAVTAYQPTLKAAGLIGKV